MLPSIDNKNIFYFRYKINFN